MLYKLTSVKRVIAKVLTDLDIKEGDHRISDMVEWAGEGLEKIGAFPSLVNKVTGRDDVPYIEISNYQAKLPCDFHQLIQVSFSTNVDGPYYPMRYGSGSFDYGKVQNTVDETVTTFPESTLVTLAMVLYSLDYDAALAKINNEPTTKANLEGMLQQMNVPSLLTSSSTDNFNTTYDYTYVITSNYIKTNVASGYIQMAYQAIPVDNNGYPMIPDTEEFMEALYWYINMKMMYPEWKMGRVRDQVYYDARRSWNYYRKNAYGSAMMPNQDQLESIKNSWNRLVPELNEWRSGFSTLGQEQYIYDPTKK